MSATMRDMLAEHGLPTIWAVWAEQVMIDREANLSEPFRVYRPEPPGPTVEEWEDDGAGGEVSVDRARTPAEMAEAEAAYRENLSRWVAEHGDAASALVRVSLGPPYWSAKIDGNGRSVGLLRDPAGGPWRLMTCSGIDWNEAKEALMGVKPC